MESRKVSDLSNEELLKEIEDIDIQITSQYKIISHQKAVKNEFIEELKNRLREVQ